MSAQDQYSFLYKPSHSLGVFRGDDEVCTYRFGTGVRKPHIHPCLTPDGVALTVLEPSDHIWHRGIWFAWKYINGVNYWEEDVEAGSDGPTIAAGDELVELSQGSGRIEHDLIYADRDTQDSLLHEHRRVVMSAPGEPWDRGLAIDWTMRFRADQDVELDRTVICDETPWGGYAGMSWRAARSLVQFRIMNSEGKADLDAKHQAARWVGMDGLADGQSSTRAGVAILDHPENPRHPSPWKLFDSDAFGYTNPALLLNEGMAMKRGQEITLRYRVLTYDGPSDRAAIDRAWEMFARR